MKQWMRLIVALPLLTLCLSSLNGCNDVNEEETTSFTYLLYYEGAVLSLGAESNTFILETDDSLQAGDSASVEVCFELRRYSDIYREWFFENVQPGDVAKVGYLPSSASKDIVRAESVDVEGYEGINEELADKEWERLKEMNN